MTQKVLGNKKKGLIFIISAPSATGKTTIANMLTEEFDCVEQSVSCTTRPIREGEEDGTHYHFISEEEFKARAANGEFVENKVVYNNHYGTLLSELTSKTDAGKHVLVVIDTQGGIDLIKNPDVTAISIFMVPPSLNALERRLRDRATDSEEQIQMRLANAEKELQEASSYDYVVVNDQLEAAYDCTRAILIAEEQKQKEE